MGKKKWKKEVNMAGSENNEFFTNLTLYSMGVNKDPSFVMNDGDDEEEVKPKKKKVINIDDDSREVEAPDIPHYVDNIINGGYANPYYDEVDINDSGYDPLVPDGSKHSKKVKFDTSRDHIPSDPYEGVPIVDDNYNIIEPDNTNVHDKHVTSTSSTIYTYADNSEDEVGAKELYVEDYQCNEDSNEDSIKVFESSIETNLDILSSDVYLRIEDRFTEFTMNELYVDCFEDPEQNEIVAYMKDCDIESLEAFAMHIIHTIIYTRYPAAYTNHKDEFMQFLSRFDNIGQSYLMARIDKDYYCMWHCPQETIDDIIKAMTAFKCPNTEVNYDVIKYLLCLLSESSSIQNKFRSELKDAQTDGVPKELEQIMCNDPSIKVLPYGSEIKYTDDDIIDYQDIIMERDSLLDLLSHVGLDHDSNETDTNDTGYDSSFDPDDVSAEDFGNMINNLDLGVGYKSKDIEYDPKGEQVVQKEVFRPKVPSTGGVVYQTQEEQKTEDVLKKSNGQMTFKPFV